MDHSIRAVFEDECSKLVIDNRFVKKLHNYVIGFTHKNQDHIAFFGGNLLGVQVVRFTDVDRDEWFNEILEADDMSLEDRLLALPTVNADWNVSSDTMNLSCVWLLHAIFTSKLVEKDKHQALVDVALVLQFKFLTSRLYRHFKYPADKAVAEATYAQLSYKYDIKRYGSWQALFNARAEELISKEGIHYKTIVKMDVDTDVTYMLNDVQGRIRDMLKNLYGVFKATHDQGVKISTTSMVTEHDGEEFLKDRTKNLSIYGNYLKSIISDKNSFIRDELVTVIEKMMHTMSPRLFKEALEWMSNNYMQRGATLIEEVVDETLVHSFDYFSENRKFVRNTTDLPGLLGRLRGVYMSSRSTDPALMQLREKAELLVEKATQSKSTSMVSSIRTGVLLYVVARTICMHHYSNAGS